MEEIQLQVYISYQRSVSDYISKELFSKHNPSFDWDIIYGNRTLIRGSCTVGQALTIEVKLVSLVHIKVYVNAK